MFSTGGDSPRAIRLIRCNSEANSQSGGEKKACRLSAGCRFLLILSKSSYQHPVSILFLFGSNSGWELFVLFKSSDCETWRVILVSVSRHILYRITAHPRGAFISVGDWTPTGTNLLLLTT